MFTRNIPLFKEIDGGAQIEFQLDLNGGDWCAAEQCSPYYEKGIGGKLIQFEPNDTIIVIYDVKDTNEGDKMGVWYGVVATHQIYAPTQ